MFLRWCLCGVVLVVFGVCGRRGVFVVVFLRLFGDVLSDFNWVVVFFWS